MQCASYDDEPWLRCCDAITNTKLGIPTYLGFKLLDNLPYLKAKETFHLIASVNWSFLCLEFPWSNIGKSVFNRSVNVAALEATLLIVALHKSMRKRWPKFSFARFFPLWDKLFQFRNILKATLLYKYQNIFVRLAPLVPTSEGQFTYTYFWSVDWSRWKFK